MWNRLTVPPNPNARVEITPVAKAVLSIVEATSHRELHRIQHPAKVLCFDISPDQQTLAVADVEGSVWPWNIATGQLMARFQTMVEATGGLTKFSADGRKLAFIIETPCVSFSGGHVHNCQLFVWSAESAR